MIAQVYLGLGSNVGNRKTNIVDALNLVEQISEDLVVSRMYETTPDGYLGQRRFINAACRIWTRLNPYELMEKLKEFQANVGGGASFVNGPRSVDLDILTYGKMVINLTPILTIPHPRLTERVFVLEPLAEIAPDLKHPITKESVLVLLRRARALHTRKLGGNRLGTESSTG